jgi:hypothetical protein
MPQITTQKFEGLPLRAHDFLVGVPLHDVWAVDLPRARSGSTLDRAWAPKRQGGPSFRLANLLGVTTSAPS